MFKIDQSHSIFFLCSCNITIKNGDLNAILIPTVSYQ